MKLHVQHFEAAASKRLLAQGTQPPACQSCMSCLSVCQQSAEMLLVCKAACFVGTYCPHLCALQDQLPCISSPTFQVGDSCLSPGVLYRYVCSHSGTNLQHNPSWIIHSCFFIIIIVSNYQIL